MRSIEIDEEVFEFLKHHAEPLTDKPNDVLRRLLLSKGDTRLSIGNLPEIPAGTPKSLEQVLVVSWMTLKTPSNRVQAVQTVADINGISFQTVTDKCCRQLGLSSNEFDELLAQPHRTQLRIILKKKFPKKAELIDLMLG